MTRDSEIHLFDLRPHVSTLSCATTADHLPPPRTLLKRLVQGLVPTGVLMSSSYSAFFVKSPNFCLNVSVSGTIEQGPQVGFPPVDGETVELFEPAVT